MGADLVEVSGADEAEVGHREGRAVIWIRAVDGDPVGSDGFVARVRFRELSEHTTTHDLALSVPVDQAADPHRQRLLLLGSRTADVRAFARRMGQEGWRPVAHSDRAALHEADYALCLIDRPAHD